MMQIFINGKFYSRKNAKVSVYDHGFMYGDGVFETMCAFGNGEVFLAGKHIERLRRSAKLIDLHLPWTDKYLLESINKALRRNRLKSAYIRLTVSRGEGPLGIDIRLCKTPTLVIIAEPLKTYPEKIYQKGVQIAISSIRRNHPACLNPEIKSLNFLNNILARNAAGELARGIKEPYKPANYSKKSRKFFEVLMLNLAGNITEGTVSNVFIVKNGTLLTPSRKSGVMSGITRDIVLEIARKNGIGAKESLIKAARLLDADECFLTNTSGRIMPVEKVCGHLIKSCPGPVTRLLQTKYNQIIFDSTGYN